MDDAMAKMAVRKAAMEQPMRAATKGTGPTAMPVTVLPKGMAKGGKVGSASKRADGIAQRGKTKGRMR